MLAPAGLAYAVTVRTAEPARFLRDELPAILEVPGAPEGQYVEVVNGGGERVWVGSAAIRAGSFRSGVRDPALAGCRPTHFGQTSAPPPCPVE